MGSVRVPHMVFCWYPLVISLLGYSCEIIRSVHLSESVTIAAFQTEPAGWEVECLFNECWMNVMLVWDLFPFLSVITLRIPISSVALRSDTSAARFKWSLFLMINITTRNRSRNERRILIFVIFKMRMSLWCHIASPLCKTEKFCCR